MSFSPYTGKAPYTYISYDLNDKDAALQLAEFLGGDGIHVWLDVENQRELRIRKLYNAHVFTALLGEGCGRSDSSVYNDILLFRGKKPDEQICAVHLDNFTLENAGGIELLLKDGCTKFRFEEKLKLSDTIRKIYDEKKKIKKKRSATRLLTALACVIVIVAAGLLFYNFQYPLVSDAVGSYSEDRIFALEKLGFSIKRLYEYSYDIRENVIISQSDVGRLRRGSTINMTISLGAKAIPFEDALSEELMRQGLDVNADGRISQEEIDALVSLDISGVNATSIYGLENATALKKLDISDNNINDITYLSRLTLLTELYADNNSIVDISPLVSAEQLSILCVRNNQISDIKCLDFFKSLQEVNLSGNPINDTIPAMRITNDLH
jgi:hypothetical protein